VIYLYLYLGIGVSALALIYGVHRLTSKDDSETIYDVIEAVNPDRRKHSYRILNNIIVPALAAVAVVLIWPVIFYMWVRELLSKKYDFAAEEEREFAVGRSHLQERLSLQEIEVRETVYDPLGAAPDLPFGHLNAAWLRFLDGLEDGDELWTFTAKWQTTWGLKEVRGGYVLVRNDNPGNYFLTEWKQLPEEDETRARMTGLA